MSLVEILKVIGRGNKYICLTGMSLKWEEILEIEKAVYSFPDRDNWSEFMNLVYTRNENGFNPSEYEDFQSQRQIAP